MSTYTTASLVQAELRATTSFSVSTSPTLTQVTTWIDEESAYVDHITADVYAQTTITDEYLDYDGGEYLYLRHSPIIDVTSLSYNSNPLGSSLGTSWLTKSEDTDFVTIEKSGVLFLPFTTFYPVCGKRRFKCTYISGYSTTPATTQMLTTKLVADRVLSSGLNKNVNESTDGGSISVGSISITDPAAYGVQNYKRLKDDIATLKEELAVGTGVYRY